MYLISVYFDEKTDAKTEEKTDVKTEEKTETIDYGTLSISDIKVEKGKSASAGREREGSENLRRSREKGRER